MNIAVVAAMPKIEEALSEVRHTVHNLKKTLHSVICMVRRKKKIYILKLIKTFALCLVLVFARGKYKRMTAYSQVVLLALEYMDSLGLKVL